MRYQDLRHKSVFIRRDGFKKTDNAFKNQPIQMRLEILENLNHHIATPSVEDTTDPLSDLYKKRVFQLADCYVVCVYKEI